MSERQSKQLTRHDMREIALRCVYQHLLLGKDIRKCLYEAMKGNNEVDGYLYSLTIGTVEHEQEYIDIISKYLRKDWDFDRLSVLDSKISTWSTSSTTLAAIVEKTLLFKETVPRSSFDES